MTTESVLEDVLGGIGSVVRFAIAPWRIASMRGCRTQAWSPDLKRISRDPKAYSFERLVQKQDLEPLPENAGRMVAIKVKSASGKPLLFVPIDSSPKAIDMIVAKQLGKPRFGRDHVWAYKKDYYRIRPLVGPAFDSVLVVVNMSDTCKILQTKPQVKDAVVAEIEEAKRRCEMIVLLKGFDRVPTECVLEAIRGYEHAACFHGDHRDIPGLLQKVCKERGFAPRSYRFCGIACQDDVDTIAHYLVHDPEIHVELLMDRLFPPYENGPMRFSKHDRILRRGRKLAR